jgi:peptidoglycan/xylan/chitin deacetylase (PgdA/CDA1 family)
MLITAIVAALALAFGKVWLCVSVVIALLVLIGFGSAIPQMRFFGPFICRGATSRRCVALTFDDGPDSRSTPALLDLLRETGVSAAFFCVGKRVEEHPGLAARIAREGHLVENHSHVHSYATNIFSVARLRSELEQAQSVIEQATGVAPCFYRPPVGLSNPRTFRVARKLGLTVVGWGAGGLDTMLADPAKIVVRIERRLKPGAIILLHDGNIPAGRLVETVKLLLERLRVLGYETERLDRILP